MAAPTKEGVAPAPVFPGNATTDDEIWSSIAETLNITEGDGQKNPPAAKNRVGAQDGQGNGQAEEDDDLDFGDMPNGKIRYDKLKGQLSEKDKLIAELQQQNAEFKGKLSVLGKSDNDEGQEPEVDPTENMTETERLLYKRSEQLEAMLKQVLGKQNLFDKKEAVGKLQSKEEAFFASNPSLQQEREAITGQVIDYINAKPRFKEMLVKGEMDIADIYVLATGRERPQPAQKQVRVQNPDGFLSGNRRSATPPASPRGDDYNNAAAALRSPVAKNRAEALHVMESAIMADIQGFIERN